MRRLGKGHAHWRNPDHQPVLDDRNERRWCVSTSGWSIGISVRLSSTHTRRRFSIGDAIGCTRTDDELRAAPVVAYEGDILKLQFREEIGGHAGDGFKREIRAVGHRPGVGAERQFRDDAAVAAAEGIDDLCPYGAVHEHAVEQNDDRASTTGVGVHVTRAGGAFEMHPKALPLERRY